MIDEQIAEMDAIEIPTTYDFNEVIYRDSDFYSVRRAEVRKTLMPIAYKYSLSEILPACKEYFEKTGRRLTFEYSLVQGVNDNLDEAKRLADLIKDMHGHVNLIPVNPIKERDYKQSNREAIEQFKNYLERKGINVTVRREMGRDIGGACGQLRKSYLKKEEGEA